MRGSRALVTIPKFDVADVPVRIHKLRVVEDVEKFETQIESEILFNCGVLQDAEIGVVKSWTMEGAAGWRVPKRLRECVLAPQRRWQEVASRGRSGNRDSPCADSRSAPGPPIRHIRGGAADQRMITTALVQLDREIPSRIG